MVSTIITDLDSTLLRSDKSISEHTISTLKECRAKGIKIVFATARSTQSASQFLDQFAPDIFIGYGGALVLAGTEVIHRFDIPADVSFALISECLRTPQVSAVHAINESVALENNRSGIETPDTRHYRHSDFAENNGVSYLKISLVASDPDAVERIASHYPMCDMLRYTGEDLYRFANRNALKWNAIKAMAEYYNVCADKLIAFGDDINDLEMIQNCGTGVAVENAIDAVKAVATHICETNDNDGVANWLREYVLQY